MHNEYRTIDQYKRENWKGSSDLVDIYIDGRRDTIGENCFDSCPNLANVNISKSITIISEYAFSNCPVLKSVYAPNVEEIGERAFSNCIMLQDLYFPSVTTISDYGFYSCSSLTSIFFNNIEDIREAAFASCDNLVNVTFNSVGSIGSSFSEESNLILTVYSENFPQFPDSFIEVYFPNAIGAINYFGKTKLKKLFAPKARAVYNLGSCSSLIEVNLSSVETVQELAFTHCDSLESIYLPNVKLIEWSAFSKCTSLKYFESESLTTLKRQVFGFDSNLTSFIAPNLETIEEKVFFECIMLERIECNRLTKIGSYSFYHDIALKTFIAPKLKIIGNKAFEGCINLANIQIEMLETLGTQAFYGCEKLTSINIPHLNIISKQVFYGCTSLTSITTGLVEIIGDQAFTECNSLKNIPPLQNCSSIGSEAFLNCKIDVKSITILGGDYIGFLALSGAQAESLTIKTDNTQINHNAFDNNKKLKFIYLPQCFIAWNAFSGCNNIVMIYITNAAGLDIHGNAFGNLSVCIYYSGSVDCNVSGTIDVIQEISSSVFVGKNYQKPMFCGTKVVTGLNRVCKKNNIEPTIVTEYGNSAPYAIHFIISLV